MEEYTGHISSPNQEKRVTLVVCVSCAYLSSLMALQSHANVEVTVTEAKAILGGPKQAELSFICGFKQKKRKSFVCRCRIEPLHHS